MSLVVSKAILLALAPLVHQETFWSNVGFRQADDCPYFDSCFDIPYGDSKWNGNLSKTSTFLSDRTTLEGYGPTEYTNTLLGSLTKRTESFTIQTGNTPGGTRTTSSIFVNSHPPHRPSNGRPWKPDFNPGNACDNPGKGRPPFCNPEPEYPAPIPLPAPIAFLLTGLMGFGVFKMFQKMDDLENIR